MKKRFYAVLLTSFFLVGIMAAAAAAAADLVKVEATAGTNVAGHTAVTTAASAAGGTSTAAVSGIRVGEVASIKITKNAATTKVTLDTTVLDEKTATVTLKNSDSATVASLDITGIKAGTTKIRFIAGDKAESMDISITVQAAAKPQFWTENTGTNLDLGHLYDPSNDAFFSGQTVDSGDTSFDKEGPLFGVSFDVARGTAGNTTLVATFDPKADGLTFVPVATSWDHTAKAGKSEDVAYGMKGYIKGTMPTVTKDTKYTMTLTPTDAAGNTVTGKKYTFTVFALPDISKVKDVGDIKWGDEKWKGYTPAGTNVDSWDIGISDDKGVALVTATYLVSADQLENSADIVFSNSDGSLKFATGKKSWKPGHLNDYIIKSSDLKSPTEKKIRIVAYRGKGPKQRNVSKDITINFITEAPTLVKKLDKFTFNWSEDIKSADNYIEIEGPGAITIDSSDNGLPDGISFLLSTDNSDTYITRVYLTGKPAATTKSSGAKAVFTASNAVAKKALSVNPVVVVQTDRVSFDVKMNDNAKIPSGDVMIEDSVSEVTLRAFPGPITWKAEGLPRGVTLTADKEDSTKAVLAGTYDAARSSTAAKDRLVKITATNSDYKKSAVISVDLMVWPKLSFKTKTDKNIKIKANADQTITIDVNGFPTAKSWDVKLNEKSLITAGNWTAGGKGVSMDDGTAVMSIDLAALSKDSAKLIIKGSWDRVPKNGATVPLVLTARSPVQDGNTATATYNIEVQGVAPKFGSTKDITLEKSAEKCSKDLELAAGTPKFTMTATIDKSTAGKIFGAEDAITLDENWNTTTGLSFDCDELGKFTFKVSKDMNVAYKKLPITVTAKNADVSDKDTTAKITITVAGQKPSWLVVNSLDAFPFNCSAAKQSVDVSGKTLAVMLDASQTTISGDNYIKFVVSGDGPLTVTVKPNEAKNGITPELQSDKRTVLFKGAPTAEKGDTTTKFSLDAKNPSTGESAKLTISFTAVPKPVVDDTEKTEKARKWKGIYGKKVKIAPKLTKKNKNVKWVIEAVSTDATYPGTMSGYGAANDKLGADTIKDAYGLIFDSKKGTITGAMNKSTGDGDDKALYIYLRASGDVTSSDIVKTQINVLGAKTKLKTKSVKIDIEGKNMNPAAIETDMKNVDSSIASVDIAGTFEDAASGLSFTYNNDNTFGFSGNPSQVVKKAKVPVVFNNYDTETKGNLSVVIDGLTPEIHGTAGVSVTAGGPDSTVDVSISNSDKVSEKIKWKIEKKPTASGVSAKIKGNGTSATITAKASKKATAGSPTFTITATDSITKKTSAVCTVTINVAAASTTDAPELMADKPEVAPETTAETEKTALGEGKVRIGHERTASGLTAAQRTFLADNGYVIAAVLPEIEVEEADGQYEFEVDELEEAAKTGSELVYFAFASKPSTDDEIATFADAESGEETTVLPESRKLIVAPWLNVGTKYAPVIAVKAEAGEAEAVTSDDVKAQAEAKAEEAEETSEDVKPELKEDVKEVKEEVKEAE